MNNRPLKDKISEIKTPYNPEAWKAMKQQLDASKPTKKIWILRHPNIFILLLCFLTLGVWQGSKFIPKNQSALNATQEQHSINNNAEATIPNNTSVDKTHNSASNLLAEGQTQEQNKIVTQANRSNLDELDLSHAGGRAQTAQSIKTEMRNGPHSAARRAQQASFDVSSQRKSLSSIHSDIMDQELKTNLSTPPPATDNVKTLNTDSPYKNNGADADLTTFHNRESNINQNINNDRQLANEDLTNNQKLIDDAAVNQNNQPVHNSNNTQIEQGHAITNRLSTLRISEFPTSQIVFIRDSRITPKQSKKPLKASGISTYFDIGRGYYSSFGFRGKRLSGGVQYPLNRKFTAECGLSYFSAKPKDQPIDHKDYVRQTDLSLLINWHALSWRRHSLSLQAGGGISFSDAQKYYEASSFLFDKSGNGMHIRVGGRYTFQLNRRSSVYVTHFQTQYIENIRGFSLGLNVRI